jgi:hypothetical protein
VVSARPGELVAAVHGNDEGDEDDAHEQQQAETRRIIEPEPASS